MIFWKSQLAYNYSTRKNFKSQYLKTTFKGKLFEKKRCETVLKNCRLQAWFFWQVRILFSFCYCGGCIGFLRQYCPMPIICKRKKFGKFLLKNCREISEEHSYKGSRLYLKWFLKIVPQAVFGNCDFKFLHVLFLQANRVLNIFVILKRSLKITNIPFWLSDTTPP